MKNRMLLFMLVCHVAMLDAQGDYSVAAIPSDLLPNADVVVRQFDLRFEVINKGEALIREHKVLTLLNEQALNENTQYFPYDKLEVIEDIEGVVYDNAGKALRRIRKKDIADVKAYENDVTDTRVKIIEFARRPFPYTIEYTITKSSKALMFYPDFTPQSKASESVENASLEIVMPKGLDVRVKTFNLPENCQTAPGKWMFRHITAFEREPLAPESMLPIPRILSAPTQFAMEGYEGDMNSWKAFGAFIAKLNDGKDHLPAETVAKLKALTADCSDDACKTERLYAYLQGNTRYFNIALGIGGWQPMKAGDVDAFKYGDCKGLSNYMVSMLHSVGVPAYYALIRSQEDEQRNQYPDFPNPAFNHAFACVPLEKDTLWLECTSQIESCGFLGYHTDDRPALVVTPEGGQLGHTPKYDETTNTVKRETQLDLQADGSATLISKNVYRGIPSIQQAKLSELHRDEQKKELYESISLSDFEIKNIQINVSKGRIPEAVSILELAVPKFASASGKRLFVPVLSLSQKISPLPVDSARQFPIQVTTRGFMTDDYLSIAIPEGYSLENAVSPQSFSTVFGSYELSITNEANGRLLVHRKLILNNSIQPKEQFETLQNFFKSIAKADKTKLVLSKGA